MEGIALVPLMWAALSSSAPALPPAERSWVTARTWFDPDTHGWPFPNDRFAVCAAPTCKMENALGNLARDVLEFRWALCGGMSLSALRRFRGSSAVEDFSAQLKDGELVPAQLDTLVPATWAKFVEWQAKPDQPHTLAPHSIGYSTKVEWPLIRNAIDQGAPVILGVIRTGPTNDPSEAGKNHQVLAIGYQYAATGGDIWVFAYDPNHPRAIATLSMNFDLPENQIGAAQDTGEKVRGFFTIPVGSGAPGSPPAAYWVAVASGF